MVVNQLKEEILILKNQLLLHRNCDCNVIQQYIQTSTQFSQQMGQSQQHHQQQQQQQQGMGHNGQGRQLGGRDIMGVGHLVGGY